jgi:hypothetical protein
MTRLTLAKARCAPRLDALMERDIALDDRFYVSAVAVEQLDQLVAPLPTSSISSKVPRAMAICVTPSSKILRSSMMSWIALPDDHAVKREWNMCVGVSARDKVPSARRISSTPSATAP